MKKIRRLVTTLIISLGLALQVACANSGETTMSHKDPGQIAKEYIVKLKQDDTFLPNEYELIPNKKIEPSVLKVFAQALATENNDHVRRNVVDLLRDMDFTVSHARGTLTNPEIIKILSTVALLDANQDTAAEILAESCTQATLAQYHDAYLQAVKAHPGTLMFRLIAKAKLFKAKDFLDELAESPDWNVASLQIARAALGNTELEDKYIAATNNAHNAKDVEKFEKEIVFLGQIGTKRSLAAACSYLRTPLQKDRPGISRITARLYVLDALSYNFPENEIFYRVNINSQEDYAAVENYCAEHFGVKFEGPLPPYFKEKLYPHMYR